MNLRDLYNFKSCMDTLSSHEWEVQPYACLTGGENAGKTRLIDEFIAQLVREEQLVFGFDGRQHTDEAQLVRRAVAGAALDELRQSRTRLSSSNSQVVIAGDFNRSDVRVTLGRRKQWTWYAPWRPKPHSEIDPHGELFPGLLADIESLQRNLWVILDHWDDASPQTLELVDLIAQRLRLQPRLRLITVKRSAPGRASLMDAPALSGIKPLVVDMRPLSRDQLREWADRLEIDLRSSDVEEALYTLSEGRPGAVWNCFAQLSVNPIWSRQDKAINE